MTLNCYVESTDDWYFWSKNTTSWCRRWQWYRQYMNINMNLFNHNNNSADDYDIVQLNSCGCWI